MTKTTLDRLGADGSRVDRDRLHLHPLPHSQDSPHTLRNHLHEQVLHAIKSTLGCGSKIWVFDVEGCQILFGSSFSVKVGRGGTKSLYRYICQIQREKYERITAG